MASQDPTGLPPTGAAAEPGGDFAGSQDGFERLWTPHRLAYITGERPSESAGEGCPFCAAPGRGDRDGLIVHRGETCFVVMNLFPYNPGHVLICPYRHVSLYVDLTDEEMDLRRQCYPLRRFGTPTDISNAVAWRRSKFRMCLLRPGRRVQNSGRGPVAARLALAGGPSFISSQTHSSPRVMSGSWI